LDGNPESGTKHLTQAVAACTEALKERTRDKVPLDWAETQNNLGNALRALGERQSNPTLLQQAIGHCNAALEVFRASKATYYLTMTEENPSSCPCRPR